jgi:hypothetical protein
MVAKFQPGDLHVIASIHGWAVRGDGTIEQIGFQRFAHAVMETFFASGQRLDGLGKFTGDVADQFEL